MLRPDPALPLRDLAWSRSRILELLDREVLPALRPGARVVELERSHTAYKAGKECLVLYGVRTEGDPAPWLVTITVGPAERLRTLFSRHYADADPSAPRRAMLLDLPCLVEIFPSDWKLRDLARAADPGAAAELLGLGPAAARALGVECLRYRPRRRCVLRYRVGDGDAGDAVAKVYHDGRKAAQVRGKLRRLAPAARPRGLRLPRPRGRPAGLAVVLMERLEGQNLADRLEATRTRAEARPLVEIAGRALAAFHALAPPGRETRRFEDEIGRLRLRGGRLAAVSPDVARRVKALLERIEERLARLGADEFRLVHGDFKPSQLLVEDERPALVDLDRACCGDPALDLGNFLAVLRKQVVLKGSWHVGEVAPAFLAAYRERAERPGSEARARLFEVFALARMLVRNVERAPHGLAWEGDAWRPLRLLDEAERGLDALGAG
jgi:aminoglycoside phosphotransferase (APT) family kinase protein